MLADIETLSAQIAQGGSDAQALQAKLDELESALNEMADYFWIISEQSLAWYRAHDAGVQLKTYSPLISVEFYQLTLQYLDGQLSLDGLIREIDRREQMQRLEQQ